jgi:hypothetical protein
LIFADPVLTSTPTGIQYEVHDQECVRERQGGGERERD